MRKMLVLFILSLVISPLLVADEFKPKFDSVQEKRYRDFSNVLFIMYRLNNTKSIGENLEQVYPVVFTDIQEFISENPDTYFLPEVKIIFADLYVHRIMQYAEHPNISQAFSKELKDFYLMWRAVTIAYLLDIVDNYPKDVYFHMQNGADTDEMTPAIALYYLVVLTGDKGYLKKLKNDYPVSQRIKDAKEVLEQIKQKEKKK